MTLCMAAICKDEGSGEGRIVICADKRVEVSWAGGSVGFKLSWASADFAALMAGDVSKAEDLLATSRELLGQRELNVNNAFDVLNEVSSLHKKKLCERLVSTRLGISFERFLANGQNELPLETRSRLLLDLEDLNFGCSLIIAGFVSWAHVFTIDDFGTVVQHQNFAAIGTGSIIAKSTLYQREQSSHDSVEATMYKLYEASRLAMIAPGVGDTQSFVVIHPPTDKDDVPAFNATGSCLSALERKFREIGPKPFDSIELKEDSFRELPMSDAEKAEKAKGGKL